MKQRVRQEKGVHVLSLTQRCNNFCVMCYEPHLFNDHPSFEELKKEILGIKNPSEIYITGGEPTIRPDLVRIIHFIKKTHSGVKVNLITNGRMLSYPSLTKKLKLVGINKIITELHGSNPKIHDEITQAEGSFNEALKGIKNMIEFKINTELRIVINKINKNNLPALAQFIVNSFKTLERVVIFPINIIGYAYKNRDNIATTFTETKLLVQKALDILSNKFDVKLFHYPFCVIDKKYWKHVEGVTTDPNRLAFVSHCSVCIKKEDCPRIWKTYIHNFGDKEFMPLENEKN